MIYFVIAYIVFLIIFAIFSAVVFYHLRRYGYREGAGNTMFGIFSLTVIIIVVVTFILLSISGYSIPDNFQIG